MANPLLAAFEGFFPSFLSLVLLSFALILVWFKRRTLARKLPNVAADFLTRHVERVKSRYP